MAHMREEKITQQPGLLRPPKGAALREYQVQRGQGGAGGRDLGTGPRAPCVTCEHTRRPHPV